MVTPSARRQPQKEPETNPSRAGLARTSGVSGPWLVWVLWTLSAVLVFCGGVLLAVNLAADDEINLGYWLNNAVAALALSTVGALVASRRRENIIGWLFGTAGLLYGLAVFAGEYGVYALITDPGSLPGGIFAVWVASWLWIPSGSLVLFSFLVFPDGRLPSPRWRLVAILVGFAVCSLTVSLALMPGALEGAPGSLPLTNPFGLRGSAAFLGAVGVVSTPLVGATALASVAAVILRLRRAQGEERQQLKWVAYAVVVMGVAVIASSLSAAIDRSLFGRMLFLAGFLAIPVAFGLAILRYRLYDIDLVINRTLVYGALTACVVGVYVLVVGYLGALLRVEDSLLISLVATGIVAVLFAPLRDRLQRFVNRLMYGERDDPYAVLSRLGERLEAALEPAAVLPAVAETVATALRLPYAAVALRQPVGEPGGEGRGGFTVAAAHGSPPAGPPVRLPLVHRHETVGELLLAPRAGEGGFSPADRRLLDDLARQAAVAAHAVLLTADLQRARERLVGAREEERRRLRRDLHDGLGPQLSSQALTADAALTLLRRDPDAARGLLLDLKVQAKDAVADIRRVVHDLRPPALDDLGLLGALRETAARHNDLNNGPRVRVEAPDGPGLPPLPAAVEVAAYRIVQEALTNVVRHSGAAGCAVRLSLDGEAGALRVEVRDDGRGLPDRAAGDPARPGVGLASMRERAAELGGTLDVGSSPEGGTVVRAELPLPGVGQR